MATARLVKKRDFSDVKRKTAQRKALQRAQVAARQIRKAGGSARAEVIGGKVKLIEIREPDIVEETSRRETPLGTEITGFTRADVVKRKALEDKRQKLIKEREKELSRMSAEEVAKKFVRGGFIPQEIPRRQADISIQRVAETPSLREISTQQIVQTLPSNLKIVSSTKADIPRKKRLEQEQFLKEVKPITPSTRIQKIERNVIKPIRNFENKVSKVIGTSRLANAIEKYNENRFKGKENIPFPEKVSEEILTGILRNPLSNAALALTGVGITAAVGRAGLAYTKTVGKLAKESPKIAKALGISSQVVSKGSGAIIGTVYAKNVIDQGVQEYTNTGKITKTTSDAIRELALFSIGGKFGKSTKIEKLTQLQKEFNKLPKSQQEALAKRLNKISELAPKEFKGKELGITTELERLSIKQVVKNGRITEDVAIVSRNKIFFVKEGNIPKKTKSFFVDVVGIEKKGAKGIEISKGLKGKIKVKYNSQTGKLEPVGTVKFEDITVKEALSLSKKVKPGKIIETKEVAVKGFTKDKKIKILALDEIQGIPLIKEIGYKKLSVNVKPSKRKVKKILDETVKKQVQKSKLSKNIEILSFKQFTPTEKPKTTKKVVSSNKDVKFDEYIYTDLIDGKTVGFQIKKDNSLITTSKTTVKKPIIDTVVITENTKSKLLPIKLPKSDKKKTSSKVIKQQSNINNIKGTTKLLPKIKKDIKTTSVIKPKINVSSKLKGRSKTIGSIKPGIKSLPSIKIDLGERQLQQPKIKVSQLQKQKEKRIKVLQFKKAKPPKIPIKIPKLKGKVKKQKLTVFTKKDTNLFFTPTLAGDTPRKKDELKQLTYSGLEVRA